jgi:hypothetical protein
MNAPDNAHRTQLDPVHPGGGPAYGIERPTVHPSCRPGTPNTLMVLARPIARQAALEKLGRSLHRRGPQDGALKTLSTKKGGAGAVVTA